MCFFNANEHVPECTCMFAVALQCMEFTHCQPYFDFSHNLQIPIGSQCGENWLYEYLRTVVRNLFLFNTNLILLYSYVVVIMFIYIYIYANTLR